KMRTVSAMTDAKMSRLGLVLDYPLQPQERLARLTPARDVFTVAHMGIADIAAEDWLLEITGLVAQPLTLNWVALKALPKRIVESVHKCAGVPLDATRPTRQVANVRWAGADLRDLLASCGVKSEARYLWASGSDRGILGDGGHAVPVAEYQKDLSLERIALG